MRQLTKKAILLVLALVCVTLTWAIVEKTEIMTVIKTDGSKVEYKVDDVEQVTFAVVEESYAILVAPAKGEAVKLEAVPAVFRAAPSADGAPYGFGISMVSATEPAEARTGAYAIEVAVSQTKLNTADNDLAGGAASGITVSLYSYKDGEVDNVWEAQTAGKLTTAINNKTKQVTFALEATFEDGTKVVVDYQGAVTDVENLKGLNPPFEYKNQGQYFNADGNPFGLFDITGLTYTPSVTYRGIKGDKFELTLSNGKDCWFILDPKFFGQTYDFATGNASEFYFCYDNIQLASKGTGNFFNEGLEGTLTVVKNEDGSFTIDAKVTNIYHNSMTGTKGGTPEYVILNYTSVAPEPEPEPEPEPIVVENQLVHVDKDGNAEEALDILEVRHQTNIGIPNNTSVKGDKFDIYFTKENAPTCYVIIMPEYIGKTLDIATAPAKSFYFKYGATEVAASGLSWLSTKVGQEGTITIVENEDGSYSLDFDISFKTSGTPDSKERAVLNYTIAAPEPEPEPEPEPVVTVESNTCLYTPASGSERTMKVESCTVEVAKSALGLTFDVYTLTLSGDVKCTVYIAADQYGKTIDFASAPDNSYYVTYGFTYSNIIDLGANNTKRPGSYNVGKKGSLCVNKDEDGIVTIDLNVTNSYSNSYNSNGGDGTRVVLNYTEPKPEPEPEPGIEPNTCVYTPASGSEKTLTIESCKTETETSFNGLTFDAYKLTLSSDMLCDIYIAADQYGKTIDFASAPDNSYYVAFGFESYRSINFGANNTKRPGTYSVGNKGSLCVTKNDDGTVTIDLDVTNKYVSGYGWDGGDGSHVGLNYTVAAPEPEVPALPNEGQRFDADGNPDNPFTVESVKYTAGVSYRGVKGDRFDFTLSNETQCYFILDTKYFGQTFDFANAGAGECYFVYGSIQLASKDTPYMNIGTTGTITVVKNEDGSFDIDFNVSNKYIPSWGGSESGTPERVVLHYSGAAQ